LFRLAISLIRSAFRFTRSMSRRSDGVLIELKFIDRKLNQFLGLPDHILHSEPVILEHIFSGSRSAEAVDC